MPIYDVPDNIRDFVDRDQEVLEQYVIHKEPFSEILVTDELD